MSVEGDGVVARSESAVGNSEARSASEVDSVLVPPYFRTRNVDIFKGANLYTKLVRAQVGASKVADFEIFNVEKGNLPHKSQNVGSVYVVNVVYAQIKTYKRNVFVVLALARTLVQEDVVEHSVFCVFANDHPLGEDERSVVADKQVAPTS